MDGVLTKGDITLDSKGNELKTFNVKDGMGIGLAKKADIEIAIITGRKSEAVAIRAKELKINFVFQAAHDKNKILHDLRHQLGIGLHEVAFMGDDLNDLSILNKVGFSGAPQNAVGLVKEAVDFVSNYNGGDGAVREFIEHILINKNDITDIIKLFDSNHFVQ